MMRLLFVAFALACRAPNAVPPAPSPADELRAFAAFLEEVHPEPFRFVQPEAFWRTVDGEARDLDAIAVPDQFDVGRAFQRVIATVGDFHLQLALPAYQPDYPEPLSLVPLAVVRIGDRVLVDGSSEDWPAGTELLQLNGEDATALWDELQAMVSVDGRRVEVQRTMLERDFAKYFHLHTGMATTYDLVVRRPDGTKDTLTLPGLSAATYRSMASERHTTKAHPSSANPAQPTLERREDGTAWLQLPSFGNPDADAFRQAVDTVFADLDDVERLVVDVRGNPGGYRGHGIAVLSHLVDGMFPQWRSLSARVTRIPKGYEGVVEPLLGEEFSLRDSFPDAKGKGPYLREDDPLLPVLIPREPYFGGTVVLFADGHTNSAANTVSLTLRRELPDLVFFGEEIGGDCDRHVGNFPVVYRTRGGVTVVVSLMSVRQLAVTGCVPGRGLRPDIRVTRTLDDYLEGVDPYWSAFETWRAGSPP